MESVLKTIYWQWHGLYVDMTYWLQYSRIHDGRRVLTLHESTSLKEI